MSYSASQIILFSRRVGQGRAGKRGGKKAKINGYKSTGIPNL